MGTPDFSVPALNALIETQKVVGVVTQPDKQSGRGKKIHFSAVKEAALAANVPVYQPKSMRTETAVSPLREWNADIIIVAAFGQILRPFLLEMPPLGCLNVHASLLPRWRGASPIQHALLAGDSESGVTLMQMNKGLDTGDLFVSETIPIHEDETAVSLHDRLSALGAEMLRRHLPSIIDGSLKAIPQNNNLSTYAPMISKADGQLHWEQSAAQIDRRIRAMTPWPSAFTHWQGKSLKILSAKTLDEQWGSQTGQILYDKERKITAVCTNNGMLQLEKIQLAGKRAMNITDFIRGRPDFIGTELGGVAG